MNGTVKRIYMALLSGVVMGWGFAAFLAFSADASRVPSPHDVRFIELLSAVHAVGASVLLSASVLTGRFLKSGDQTSYVIRGALAEGAAMLGVMTGLLAAGMHVLPSHPIFWLNALSAGGMALVLGLNLPKDERLP